jgi:hypothetical protein
MAISITRALSELKLLDARITKKVDETVFVDARKANADYTLLNQCKPDQISEDNYKSVSDLITRRQAIKSAIILSNAATDVVVAGNTMKVAEVIEMKKSIQYKKTLLMSLRQQLARSRAIVQKVNADVELSVERQAVAVLGKAAKESSDEYKNFAEMYRKSNSADLVDPMKIEEKINVLTLDVENFESECDFVLSESNAKTLINV